ncbi:MAG: response regulator, partial [candidate division NC10 bacterium]
MAAKILIVDDEENVLRMLGYALESEGHVVVTAQTGKDALAQVEAERPALIILDRMLPDISGVEVCRQLRGQSGTSDLPIIMLSAQAQVADRISGLKAGADEYVTKPFDSDELVARVGGLLERRAELARKHVAADIPSTGQIVAVFGAKGGVGQTIVAVNLAIALCQTTKKRVVLVDTNVQGGDVGTILGLHARYTILDLLARGDELDDALMSSVLVSHSSGITVLLAPDHREASHAGEALPPDKLLAW